MWFVFYIVANRNSTLILVNSIVIKLISANEKKGLHYDCGSYDIAGLNEQCYASCPGQNIYIYI
jgi:hypothetical protein